MTNERVYVATNPHAKVRAVALVGSDPSSIGRDGLCVSFDGEEFNTVLFGGHQESRSGFSRIPVWHPALGIYGARVSCKDNVMDYDGERYVLDENATVGRIVTKPYMWATLLVRTCAGYYVAAQNRFNLKWYEYLDGRRLRLISGKKGPPDDDIVMDMQYEGHRFTVRGDSENIARQTVTFDGQPATRLRPEDHELVFGDDLETVTVTVTPKK